MFKDAFDPQRIAAEYHNKMAAIEQKNWDEFRRKKIIMKVVNRVYDKLKEQEMEAEDELEGWAKKPDSFVV
jgi:exonuclease I